MGGRFWRGFLSGGLLGLSLGVYWSQRNGGAGPGLQRVEARRARRRRALRLGEALRSGSEAVFSAVRKSVG